MEPKLDPNRTQIEDGKEDAKRSASKSSWGGLGAVLERSWAILAELEAILGRFGGGWGGRIMVFPMVFQYFLKHLLFAQKWTSWPVWERSGGLLARTWGLFDRTWTDFGAPEVPKGRPYGTQEAPKKSPK